MPNLEEYIGLRLRGGFVIAKIELSAASLRDALGREATAQTIINGRHFAVSLQPGLAARELSISLYHEILEAAVVASTDPPQPLLDFNEGGFERAAQKTHDELGESTPESLNRMSQLYGFGAN